MKWMPPTPQFDLYDARLDRYWIGKEQFNDWFANEIAPLFENAVEVDCHQTHGGWAAMDPKTDLWHTENAKTHTALLINIKPIKEEDEGRKLLQEMIDYFKNFRDLECCLEGKWSERAKNYLERKGVK
jgi:hypothetical protein